MWLESLIGAIGQGLAEIFLDRRMSDRRPGRRVGLPSPRHDRAPRWVRRVRVIGLVVLTVAALTAAAIVAMSTPLSWLSWTLFGGGLVLALAALLVREV